MRLHYTSPSPIFDILNTLNCRIMCKLRFMWIQALWYKAVLITSVDIWPKKNMDTKMSGFLSRQYNRFSKIYICVIWLRFKNVLGIYDIIQIHVHKIISNHKIGMVINEQSLAENPSQIPGMSPNNKRQCTMLINKPF